MAQEETQNDAALAETLEVAQPQEQPQEQPAPEEPTQQESNQTLRFKTIREARERAERERDEIRAELDRIKASQQPKAQAQHQDYNVAPDDLVEGKHLSKYDREIKQLREQLENYRTQTTAMTVETKLKNQYPDFDSIVNTENIEMLKASYPEIAATLNSSPDLYNKAVSAYTMIKQFGIAQNPVVESQKNRVHENSAKPRPIASVNAQPGSDSPLSHANAFAEGLTKEVKSQLLREMQEAKRNR